MNPIAFSTLACPDWTLEQVAARAGEFGYSAVELRTFGAASRDFACDPALTGDRKVSSMFEDAGVDVVGLATSISFDSVVNPPVIGNAICDNEGMIRQARRAIEHAARIECPFVRVFGYRFGPREKFSKGLARVANRLELVLACARNTGVRVLIENGGSFGSAESVMALIDRLDRHPLLGCCYNTLAGSVAGDDVAQAMSVLGDRAWALRVKDIAGETPCIPGEGDVACKDAVESFIETGSRGPVIFEWDRAWRDDLAPAEEVLAAASQRLGGWVARTRRTSKSASAA